MSDSASPATPANRGGLPVRGDLPATSAPRRLATALYRHPRAQLALLLSAPLGWLLLAYIGSLALLAVSAFWRLDAFSGNIVHDLSLKNFQNILGSDIYRTVALRTIGFAAIVTITDVILAF